MIATVEFSKKNKPYFVLDNEPLYHLELTSDAPLIKGAIIFVLIDDIVENKIYGTYLKTIGHRDDPDIETLKIIYSKGWPIEFSEELLAEADKISFDLEYEKQKRTDLSHLLTFTIDGDDAKDFDDAISLEIVDDKYKLGIHIADIGYLVKKDSLIDKEAQERATSLYLVDRVIPMLPHAISNGVGSLNEGEHKLTISVIITFDKNYKMIDYEILKSIIVSDKRLTYNEVNNLFYEGKFKHIMNASNVHIDNSYKTSTFCFKSML